MAALEEAQAAQQLEEEKVVEAREREVYRSTEIRCIKAEEKAANI